MLFPCSAFLWNLRLQRLFQTSPYRAKSTRSRAVAVARISAVNYCNQRLLLNRISAVFDILGSLTLVGSWVVLCDTWKRSDDNDTVSGIEILDTTAIPEIRYAISVFFRNRQSHTLVIIEKCLCTSVCILWQGYGLFCILHEVRALLFNN